jgi:hypothetical protein
VTLGERLQAILDDLPDGWSEASLVLSLADRHDAQRAALVLASLAPGRFGDAFRLTVSAPGRGGASPSAVRRVLERLDEAGVDARLTLAEAPTVEEKPAELPPAHASLAGTWDELAATLPADWSDLYAELELASSADLDRGALLMGPVNPFLHDGPRPALRFRVAHRFGYGAAPAMTRRCLARLDEEQIGGRLRLLHVLSDTSPVLTQGPVWREGGRAV